MKKIFKLVIIMLLVSVAMSLSAKEKADYKHYLALGVADTHISNGDDPLSPLFAWYWFLEDFDNQDLYGNLALTTTKLYFKLGLKNENYFTGVKPFFYHSTYGAYYLYSDGKKVKEYVFKAQKTGAELFFEHFTLKKLLSFRAAYSPTYYYYGAIFSGEKSDDLLIDLPNNHVEHQFNFETKVGNVQKTDLSRVKHGIFAKFRHEFTRRSGYGTFVDLTESSSVKTTKKFYLDLGAYYAFENKINVHQDIYGSIQYNVDRNNAEKIGYMGSTNAVMPGYYNSEFNHDRYVISRTKVSFPVDFWSTRVGAGFNLLYMPETNNVIGLGNYSKEIYKSVSFEASMKVANMLPFFFEYAYGIDAERDGKKGDHEIRAFVLAAFGKNN